MTSLYEQDPTHWDKLAAQGKTNLREVAKHFERPTDMDKAMGIVGAAAHWHTGRNGATIASDGLAKMWLYENATPAAAEAPKGTDTRMLLIVATPDQAAKIEKIAALIGAEVTDV